ncbi:MAG: DUF1440 domain-containing protein [Candidatus Limnocylindria bacterium]
MATHQSPLAVIVKGALAGAAGTAVMGAFMERAPQLMGQLGIRLPEGPPGPTAPDTPTEELAERLAEGVAKEPLDADAKAIGGQAVHWTYGAAWGAFFGVMQSTLRLPHLLHGTAFGVLVGVVGDTVMPRLGLQNAPSRNPDSLNVMHMAGHVVFGWATALTYAALNMGKRG